MLGLRSLDQKLNAKRNYIGGILQFMCKGRILQFMCKKNNPSRSRRHELDDFGLPASHEGFDVPRPAIESGALLFVEAIMSIMLIHVAVIVVLDNVANITWNTSLLQ